MADEADLDTKVSKSEADSSDTKGDKSVNYEAKYRGLSKKYSQLEKTHETLQEHFDALNVELETAQSKARTAPKEAEKKAGDLEKQLADATAKIEKLEAATKKFDAEKATRKLITEKYAGLVEAFEAGDLKDPESFEKPEDYEAYLTRMAGRVPAKQAAQTQDDEETEEDTEETLEVDPEVVRQQEFQQQRQQFLGVTPNVSVKAGDGGKTRTMAQITEEMMRLDPTAKDYAAKSRKLETEQNAAMAAARGTRF